MPGDAQHADRVEDHPRVRWGVVLAAGLLLCELTGRIVTASPALRGVRGLALEARSVLEAVEPLVGASEFNGRRAVIYVVAEPGLYFHLASLEPQSRIAHVTQAASNLEMTAPERRPAVIPEFVVIGPHVDAAEAGQLETLGRLKLISRLDYHPSDLVALDELPAWTHWGDQAPVRYTLLVYLVTTAR